MDFKSELCGAEHGKPSRWIRDSGEDLGAASATACPPLNRDAVSNWSSTSRRAGVSPGLARPVLAAGVCRGA